MYEEKDYIDIYFFDNMYLDLAFSVCVDASDFI